MDRHQHQSDYMNTASINLTDPPHPVDTPLPACPGCGRIKNQWPGEGYTHEGETYCCQGCAEGTGCTCATVSEPGFSREGQKQTQAQPRPGEQRSGAEAPKGELSGERDTRGTEEAIDQSGCSSAFTETK